MASGLLYAAIVSGTDFKAEIGDASPTIASNSNLRDVTLSIAAQAPSADVACVTTNKITGYYIKRQDGIISVAITKPDASARVVLSFLKRVDEKLSASSQPANYQQILDTANEELRTNNDTVQLAQSEIDRVKQIMVENIDRLLERGERVNLLVDRTGEMSQSANLFNRQATSLQRKMWFQNVKVLALGGVVLVGGCVALTKI